jgi:hypothetical protein
MTGAEAGPKVWMVVGKYLVVNRLAKAKSLLALYSGEFYRLNQIRLLVFIREYTTLVNARYWAT